MRLVIAEKPSVAQSIAAVLGAKVRHDGYLEGGGYIVSWCFGHLAELADAAVYADLPHSLLPCGMHQTHFAALDFLYGG